MFLFSKKKKPSEDSVKRLEYQLCLAKEAGADDILDISAWNSLTVIPVAVGRMSSLRTLDISENSIRELPKELANVRTLESLILDAQVMGYPPASVCTAGIEEVQRYLCSEMGLEYCPPSQYLLPVLEHDGGKQEVDCVDGEEIAWQIKFLDYEKKKEQKQLEKLIFEKDLEEKQREHTQLLLLNNSRKEDVLQSVKMEQQRLEFGVSQQQKAQETERQKMLDKVRQAETNIMTRISDLLLDNKRQAKSAQFLQGLEEDRLDFMDKKFEQVLSLQQLDKSKAICQILQEEEMQKAAFEALQLQKDSVHAYIRNQMEMEQKSESNQQNYWMIQYQRLLDAKPLSLRMQEAAVDADLGNLLCKLSAQHYLPIIAHHRITAEALRRMTTKDLRKLGINEVGVQKALLHWARERTLSDPLPRTAKELQEAGPSTPSAPLQQQLTPPLTPSTPLTPTAPCPDRFNSSECVVCMEDESQVIFLPCGHVCCCQTCSSALQSCPLCRGSISQRVRLYHG
ncbi:E3 ubiquitin- ligase LRSAM1 [Labeo rohita]|uniref:E3 ubiquitin-ligase LRSAM1 n=1 Tax=Labeo rohita TaxID=84645 RepID=A0A498LQ91_LABRO|nr:E3 ubiquitin- ligase LRSAM1 [Labeo rohita]